MTNEEKKQQQQRPVILSTETVLLEIGKERRLIVSLNDAIEDLERSTDELEKEIINEDIGNDTRATRWKTKFHKQVRLNEQLEQQKSLLQEELEVERAKLTNAWSRYPNAYDLDCSMSEAELQRLVRQLEMVRQNLTGELRDVQWRLDQESKSYHQINDRCHNYKMEINSAKSSVINHKQMRPHESRLPKLHGATLPITRMSLHSKPVLGQPPQHNDVFKDVAEVEKVS